MRILVTGSAGFIGYSLVSKLLNDEILNAYYDVGIKHITACEQKID